ncbi:3'-5' exonuclease [Oceanospirillum sediminis]|uniref:Exonuclease domain-containing protein n=1 Tax=Oceanospirillum sediminis TaxID=2760088 RepID=A0A839IPL4_9GAMM|nr:hypothetical protein [Oceanospirillum sediminis]MBB1486898.1 hypothetical protein [Oceanospirillum sediminis]
MPFIIDVEASGFGRGSYPIEVGFARPDGSVFSCLIRPEPDWEHWDESAEEVHGIPRATLFEQGSSVQEVAKKLNEELEGKTVYTDSWGFDSSWLSLLFYHAGLRQLFRLETLSKLLSEKQIAIWSKVKQQVTTDLNIDRHRAGPDARMLQRTYELTSDS